MNENFFKPQIKHMADKQLADISPPHFSANIIRAGAAITGNLGTTTRRTGRVREEGC